MNRTADAVKRVWMLLCRGLPAGSYTDHCNRTFVAGDMLRDDLDNRRQVLASPGPDLLTLEVSEPDQPGSVVSDAG